MRKAIQKKISAYGLLIPALLVYTLVMVIPVFENLRISFTNWDGFSKGYDYIGFKNYIRIMTNGSIYTTFWITLKMAVLVILFQQSLGLLLAVILEKNTGVNDFFRSLFFIPNLLNAVVVGLIFSYSLNLNFGFLSPFFNAIGLHSLASIDWLGDPGYSYWAIVFACVWQFSGLSMVLYITSLKAIPGELYESADIDGAGLWQRFRHVTFPLIAPALTLNSLITLIGGLRLFDIPYVLTGGGPNESTLTIAMRLYQDAFRYRSAGFGAAQGFLLMAVILILSTIQNSYLKSREVSL